MKPAIDDVRFTTSRNQNQNRKNDTLDRNQSKKKNVRYPTILQIIKLLNGIDIAQQYKRQTIIKSNILLF